MTILIDRVIMVNIIATADYSNPYVMGGLVEGV
jgi:hypothetical protein